MTPLLDILKYLIGGLTLKSPKETTGDLLKDYKEQLYKLTKTFHLLSISLIPIIFIIVVVVYPLIKHFPEKIDGSGFLAVAMNMSWVFVLGLLLLLPKIFGVRPDPYSIYSISSIVRMHFMQVIMIDTCMILITFLTAEYVVGWGIIPIVLMSLGALVIIYPTRQRWERWISGY